MFWDNSNTKRYGERLAGQRPNAIAMVKGGPAYPNLRGSVKFYRVREGVLVAAEVRGLPKMRGACGGEIFAFHIHEGYSCSGNATDAFADAGAHYNPYACRHPKHAGDLPPLFGNNGYAWSVVLTDRFSVEEVLGRTVVIHRKPDDFTTQPAGNSGEKMACGVIVRM